MSTEIRITLEGENLSDTARQNQQRNRQTEAQRVERQDEARATAKTEAAQKKEEEQKKAAGQSSTSKFRPDEPAANRFGAYPNVLYAGATGFVYTSQVLSDGTRDRKATWQIYPFTNSGAEGTPHQETLTMANLPNKTSGVSYTISQATSGPQPYSITAGSVVSLLNNEETKYPWTITTVTETYWHSLLSEETQATLVFPSRSALFSAYGLGWFWYSIKRIQTRTLVIGAKNVVGSTYYITSTSNVTEQFTSSSGSGQSIKAWEWTASPTNAILSFPSYADNPQVKEIACPGATASIIQDDYLPEYSNFSYTTTTGNITDTTDFTWNGTSIATVVPIYTTGAPYSISVTPSWDYRAAARPVLYSANPYYRSVGNRAVTPGIYSVFTGTVLPAEQFKYYLLTETVPSSSPIAYRWRLSRNGETPIGSPRKNDEYKFVGSSEAGWNGGMESYCNQQLTSLGFIATEPAP